MFIFCKVKFCKQYYLGCLGQVIGGMKVFFGEYGIQVFIFVYVMNCQIEFVCIVMICYIKCGGKVWINIYFDCFFIKKFVEICMGFGKGFFEWWVVNVKLGCVFFEVVGVDEQFVCEVLI